RAEPLGVDSAFYQHALSFQFGWQKKETKARVCDCVLITFKHRKSVAESQAASSAVIRHECALPKQRRNNTRHVGDQRVDVMNVHDVGLKDRAEITKAERVDRVPMNEMFDRIDLDLEIVSAI